MGNTKVIATVYESREVQNRSQQINDKALVRCEYSMANFSTGDRMRKQKGDRRSTEISLVIRQSMEACILTHLMPRSQIDIFFQGELISYCIVHGSLNIDTNSHTPSYCIISGFGAGVSVPRLLSIAERERFSGNVERKRGFQHSVMDSSLKGYALDPFKCSKLTIEEKGELLFQISEWSNDAAEMF
ncbi:hypothetical protein GIB67_034086 [Kingdonia uniflora]|uniref:Exoribonuclease phosphorolytic domain-containing protein n=1 Tax=Kingdonia uniflora TaxID=39325 RepID=A0A7J7M689_9MAGN|nr:hypothetical protein GIB67_034086 [Kingdonia uniflora]